MMVDTVDKNQNTTRVLIVDDEDSIRESLEIILQEAGYDVVTAADARSALDLIENRHFDVALVDRILPGSLDGVYVIQQIKKKNHLCEAVLMSAYPSFESAARLMEQQTFAYLTKPIQQEEIVRVVGEAARRCSLHHDNERTEAILQGVFNASPNPIIVYDQQARIRFVNPAFTRLLGYTREQALGSGMLLVPEHESETVLEEFRQLLAGRNVAEREQIMHRRDGTQMHTSRIGSLCRDLRGEASYILVVIRDITEEKRMQTQIMQAEKLAMLGELAAKLAHEINNPLQIISGQTELLLRGELDEDIARQLALIGQSAHKIERLTSSLMFVARPKPQRITCVVPEKPLEKAAEFLLSIGQIKYLSIVRDYDSPDVYVEADENQLEQACMNLIVNAAHALAEAPEKCITLRTRSDYDNALVHLSVSDTGCGIDKGIRDIIFEPFFTTKPSGKGNGLGLSVVKQIVERNRGSIAVTSEPGAGSTFTLSLPLRSASGAQPHGDAGHLPVQVAVVGEKSA
jgi:PAS domain S-box-containing protein